MLNARFGFIPAVVIIFTSTEDKGVLDSFSLTSTKHVSEIDERIDSWNIPEEMSLDEFIDRVNNGELEEIRAGQNSAKESAEKSAKEISDKSVDNSEKVV